MIGFHVHEDVAPLKHLHSSWHLRTQGSRFHVHEDVAPLKLTPRRVLRSRRWVSTFMRTWLH